MFFLLLFIYTLLSAMIIVLFASLDTQKQDCLDADRCLTTPNQEMQYIGRGSQAI